MAISATASMLLTSPFFKASSSRHLSCPTAPSRRRTSLLLAPISCAMDVETSTASTSAPLIDYKSFPGKPEADVVVIGSGIGGLCCAGLLARYGKNVLVLESHDLPGGAAHSFEISGYKFDSGPSLFSGFQSRGPQANPLAQVLDALGESITCASYNSWMVYVPEADFLSSIGPTEFFKDLEKCAGQQAVEEWRKLLDAILPLSAAAMALPPLSIRGDVGVLSTAAARYAPSLLKSFIEMGPQGALGATKLLRPFSDIVDSLGIKDPFVRNWVDLLSFLLAGVKSDGILSAELIYMFSEWYKPGCCLEYPLHGSGAVVDALVRGLQKFGGRISLRSHVEGIVIERGRAVGVKLRSGQFVGARKAVVSNASMWDTLKLLPNEVLPDSYKDQIKSTPQCESFMHLHLGFGRSGIPEDLGIHHIVVNDWERGVDADQNVVLISVPSVLSPDLAPPGKHVLHAYTPGTEPYGIWEGLDRRSKEYKELKAQRSEVMWKAVERALGPGFDREKCDVELVGTPLTHQRFLRRNRGTYGPAIEAACRGKPSDISLKWSPGSAMVVVMASKGYPGSYEKGTIIKNLEEAEQVAPVKTFHAGTDLDKDGNFIAVGDRVLGVTSKGRDLQDARDRAYQAVEEIQWAWGFYRKDIGWRALSQTILV